MELPGVRTAATVVQVNGDGSLVLQAGKMKMTAKPGQVRLIEGQPQPKKRAAAPKNGTCAHAASGAAGVLRAGYSGLRDPGG